MLLLASDINSVLFLYYYIPAAKEQLISNEGINATKLPFIRLTK